MGTPVEAPRSISESTGRAKFGSETDDEMCESCRKPETAPGGDEMCESCRKPASKLKHTCSRGKKRKLVAVLPPPCSPALESDVGTKPNVLTKWLKPTGGSGAKSGAGSGKLFSPLFPTVKGLQSTSKELSRQSSGGHGRKRPRPTSGGLVKPAYVIEILDSDEEEQPSGSSQNGCDSAEGQVPFINASVPVSPICLYLITDST